jgi:hypothetical protein
VQPLHIHSVTPGDHVHFAQIAMTTPESARDIANVGPDTVAVVDAGGSIEIAKEMARRGPPRDGSDTSSTPTGTRITSSGTPPSHGTASPLSATAAIGIIRPGRLVNGETTLDPGDRRLNGLAGDHPPPGMTSCIARRV